MDYFTDYHEFLSPVAQGRSDDLSLDRAATLANEVLRALDVDRPTAGLSWCEEVEQCLQIGQKILLDRRCFDGVGTDAFPGLKEQYLAILYPRH